MKKTQIITDKSFLSLSYDTLTDSLLGEKQFFVTLLDIGDEPTDDITVNLSIDTNLELAPPTFEAIIGEPQLVSVRTPIGGILEDGLFNFEIQISNTYAEVKTVNSTVYSTEKTAPTDLYKLKYFIERQNYTCNIYELVPAATVLTPIEINGRCDLSYQDKKDLTEPIVSATLKMKLDASLDLTLEDLYSEKEKTFKVEMIKGGTTVFSGFILPDGIWADFVQDKWKLDITATCGLSSLKNIAFAQENSTGDNLVNFFGRMKAIEIISNCLQKTGLNLPIYVNCQIAYVGWVGNNILSSTYLSVERYFQNENEPMDCDAVLRSVMQIFGLTICQHKNRWYVYRAKDLTNPNPLTSDTQTLRFAVFNGATFQENVDLTFGDNIGSNINGAEKFHCNANQKITISPSVQAYQISYQFGESKNVLSNGKLISQGTVVDGVNTINIPGWRVPIPPDGANKVRKGFYTDLDNGIRSVLYPSDNPTPIPVLIELWQSISVKMDSNAVLRINYRNNGLPSRFMRFSFGITNGTTTMWFRTWDNTWVNFQEVNRIWNVIGSGVPPIGAGEAVFELTHTIPMDGDLILQIFREFDDDLGNASFGIQSVSYFPTSQGNIKSKDYIARKNSSTSSAIKNSTTVYNGDSENELFVGTIYKSDSDTPTKYWSRYYIDTMGNIVSYGESKELLEIISAEALFVAPRPMTEFEGDFKGYIDYINFVTIDSFNKAYGAEEVSKLFHFMKWTYSFDDDVTKMFVREIEESNLDSNLYNVKIYENFGNEAKVTIVS